MLAVAQSKGIHVFCYGSNSVAQLAARVGNNNLTSQRAQLPGYSRIFCWNALTWQGAVASIVEDPKGHVNGSIVSLSPEELERLNRFEGDYYKLCPCQVRTFHSEGASETEAVAYVGNSSFRQWAGVPPSQAYLVAIDLMLREQGWTEKDRVIEIKRLQDSSLESSAEPLNTEAVWSHPGLLQLSLRALFIEVNAIKRDRWTMPYDLVLLELDCSQAGIHTVDDLRAAVSSSQSVDDGQHHPLIKSIHSQQTRLLKADDLSVFRHLLLSPPASELN